MFLFLLARRLVARSAMAVAVFTFAAQAAFAAEASVMAPLRQALRGAWQQHPSYRATEAQIAAARARLDAAWPTQR